MPRRLRVELCVESADGVRAAAAAGADRVELCAALSEGGLTPTDGMVREACAPRDVPVMVMIRPRGGDFLYTASEFRAMEDDARRMRRLGPMGIVVGFLTPEGRVDVERTQRMVEIALDLQVTFHRAFDMTRDPEEALEDLKIAGVDRVLTSGQQANAADGIPLLRRLVEQAGDELIVMPGGGLEEGQVARVVRETGAREVHFAALGTQDSPMQYRNPHPFMGAGDPPGEYERIRTDPDLAARLVAEARSTHGSDRPV